MCTIYINTFAKIFSVVISGFVTESDGISYTEEFRNKVESIMPSEYALMIDTKNLQSPVHNMSDIINEMYGVPFKTRFCFN